MLRHCLNQSQACASGNGQFLAFPSRCPARLHFTNSFHTKFESKVGWNKLMAVLFCTKQFILQASIHGSLNLVTSLQHCAVAISYFMS